MAALTGYFFDTSVLVPGIIELAGPDHAAQRLLTAVANGQHQPSPVGHLGAQRAGDRRGGGGDDNRVKGRHVG